MRAAICVHFVVIIIFNYIRLLKTWGPKETFSQIRLKPNIDRKLKNIYFIFQKK